MPKYREKKCKICNEVYQPMSGNQEYCLECRDKYRKEQSRKLRKKYYQKHKWQEKKYQRQYYREHKGQIRKWRENYLKTVRGHYFSYKAEAERSKRQIKWSLTIEEFEKIVKRPCYYCGYRDGFSGVDRKDSDKGYTVDNCVPCCVTCNHMKWVMSPKEFIDRCEEIVKYSRKKK